MTGKTKEKTEDGKKGRAPDFIIVKTDETGDIIKTKLPNGKEGSQQFGAIWANTSKKGKGYMSLRIGEEKYLAFPRTGSPKVE